MPKPKPSVGSGYTPDIMVWVRIMVDAACILAFVMVSQGLIDALN